MARRAESEGMAVLDHPGSIVRCTNKVFLAELLEGTGVPTPPTLVVHSENRGEVADRLGVPCVVKIPDSSFSHGVMKAENRAELEEVLSRLLETSELLIAQGWAPTPFDWRLGVLDGQPLYLCKYFMARDHWQIYNWKSKSPRDVEGGWETLRVADGPASVVETGLRAARLLGDGLYGVDLKEVDGRPVVIEVNDNPSIEAGVEDQVLGRELYARIVGALKSRVQARYAGPYGREQGVG